MQRLLVFTMFLVVVMMVLLLTYVSNVNNHYKRLSMDIVIARYNEDLLWLCNPYMLQLLKAYDGKIRIYIYNKGLHNVDLTKLTTCLPNVSFHVATLPNVGRETHTYLHHIIRMRKTLAEVTIFLPGSSETFFKFDRAFAIIQKAQQNHNTVFIGQKDTFPDRFASFSIDDYHCTNSKNHSMNPENNLFPAHKRPFNLWFYDVFPKKRRIDAPWNYNAMFAVHRDHILQHPTSYYERMLAFVDNHPNPEAGHFFERSWGVVFSPFPETCIHTEYKRGWVSSSTFQ